MGLFSRRLRRLDPLPTPGHTCNGQPLAVIDCAACWAEFDEQQATAAWEYEVECFEEQLEAERQQRALQWRLGEIEILQRAGAYADRWEYEEARSRAWEQQHAFRGQGRLEI